LSQVSTKASRSTFIAATLLVALTGAACGPASTEPVQGESNLQAVAVQVTPPASEVPLAGQASFQAVVTGAVVTAVTWSIQEGSAGGVVNDGTYQAPATAGTFHVVATSVADPTRSAIATVTVTASPPPPPDDLTPPQVTAFAAGGTASPVGISTFTATDDTGVAGYLVTESAAPPPAGATSWQATRPTAYFTNATGVIQLFPWVKDAAGNVSAAWGSPVTVTLTAPASDAKMGTNLNWCVDWDPEKLPADLVWSARPWSVGDGNGANPGSWAPVDAQGWPLVPVGTRFGALFEGSPWPGTYKLSFRNRQGTTGDTVASAAGNIQLSNRRHDPATNVTTYDVVVPSFQSTDQFIWLMWSNTPGGTIASPSQGGITDVHLMRPLKDGSGWHAVGTALSDHIIDRLAHFTTIRVAQTGGGESGKVSGLDTSWSGRTKPWSVQTRSSSPGRLGGVAIENLVAMANQAGKDLWIEVPFLADDDYILKMAQTIRFGSDGTNPYTSDQANPVFKPLRADLKLYVEHGNEIWNPGPGYWSGENRSAAVAEVGWTADGAPLTGPDPYHLAFRVDNDNGSAYGYAWRRVGFLVVRHSLVFRRVFGDAAMMSRVRPILASQHGRYAVTTMPLEYIDAVWGPSSAYASMQVAGITNPRQPVGYYVYALATAVYPPQENGLIDPSSPASMLDSILAELSSTTAGADIPAMTFNKAQADRYGIRYVAYEGGDNLIPSLMPGGATASAIANAITASYDPVQGARMGAAIDPGTGLPLPDQSGHVYGQLFGAWARAGGGLFMHYTLGQSANSGGMFGLCPPSPQSTSDCRLESGPKWDAVKAFSRAWGP